MSSFAVASPRPFVPGLVSATIASSNTVVHSQPTSNGDTAYTLVVNQVQFSYLAVPEPCVLNLIGVQVTTAQVGGLIRLGLYTCVRGVPVDPILDTGLVIDASTTGLKNVAISQPLAAGCYFPACVSQGAASVVIQGRNGPTPFIPTGLDTTYNFNCGSYIQAGISGAFATVPSTGLQLNNNGAKVVVRAG